MLECENCYHFGVCELNHVLNRAPYIEKTLIPKLPCRVGDTVYICYEHPHGVQEATIDKIIIHQKFTQVVFTNHSEFTVWDNDWSIYKKAVFFTRDEAERALKEREKNETD